MHVAGTPGAVQRREIGNSVTTVNVDQVAEKVANNTVSEILQAKAPGVTLLPGSGTAGAGANIRIRGVSSLNAGNRPTRFPRAWSQRFGSESTRESTSLTLAAHNVGILWIRYGGIDPRAIP